MAFNECSPEWHRGQIDRIYVMSVDYPVLTNPKTNPAGFLVEMTARVSNSSVLANAIRVFTVIGEKPEPEKTVVALSNNRNITTSKKHTLPFKIDETSQANRDAVLQWECGNKFRILYENDGLLWYEENNGIGIEASLGADFIIPPDRSAVDVIQGSFTWENKFSPESCDNPLD
jgi:hypothetical protein